MLIFNVFTLRFSLQNHMFTKSVSKVITVYPKIPIGLAASDNSCISFQIHNALAPTNVLTAK